MLLLATLNQPLSAQQVFHSFDELYAYAKSQSKSLQTNNVKLTQAKKAKLAALFSIPDVTGNLLSANFTNNTRLGVNVFPAEIFGGAPGTFRTIETGIQYNTNVNSYAEIKLLNIAALYNYQLSKINIALTENNTVLTIKSLKENIANTYFNIVTLQKQYETSVKNTQVADSLLQITKNKYKAGLASKQDVNDAESNYLSNAETANQIKYLISQSVISLKILADIPEEKELIISHSNTTDKVQQPPIVELNGTKLKSYILQEKYAKYAFRSAKAALYPTISAPLSNSYNIYSSSFQIVDNSWINSNFIGLKLNVPLPSANTIAKKYSSYYDFQLAEINLQQAKIKSKLEQEELIIAYDKAVSQAKANKAIYDLRADTYLKNKQLYAKGLIGLEQTLNSFNAMVNANYNLISSLTSIELTLTKIEINNSVQ